MRLSDQTILVTGAGGFIGSYLTEELVRRGQKVRAFVRYNSRNNRGQLETLPAEIMRAVDIVMGDLKDPEAVRRAIRGATVIFHLGAMIAIPFSYTNPRDFVDTNVVGTDNVLNAALEYGVERLVHTSTSEVYGTARTTPIDEDHPLQAQSPYSASKIGADKLAESYHNSFDMPIVTVRPFNTFGPRQSARAVIPTIITQALTRPEIKLGSLHPTRDLNYVSDTVEGFIALAECDAAIGETVNLGRGQEVTVGELADKIIAIVGGDIPVIYDEQRVRPAKSEVGQLIADSAKARKLIDWQPKISLDEGLELTVAWIREHLGDYKAGIYNV